MQHVHIKACFFMFLVSHNTVRFHCSDIPERTEELQALLCVEDTYLIRLIMK